MESNGFSRYERTNIEVQVAVTTRVEVAMKVGAATESVQVTAESSLLNSEDGEVSFTVTGKQLNELPINFGIGAGAIRNPLSFAQLVPGASINGWNNITINGSNGGFKILYEGQESSSSLDPRVSDESQPSVEADPGIHAADLELCRRVRHRGQRTVQFHVEERHQPIPRQRLRLPAEHGFQCRLPFTDDGPASM